ncbi:MAG: YscQ/HrcQ family type III secretion apparatus protein, partial [Gammaproteobacteria bacterium]|nr:YscQ/HrcQ family type III secretion apparatus protein [Gammaproteobacteria bacterium]
MSDEEAPPDTTAGAIDVDALPVRLVFVAGETEVALRDLQALTPGFVFDLPHPVDRHVEVRA